MPHSFATPAVTVVAHRISKDRGAAQILTDVDLTVGAEHRVGVVGPNGVGKSTLLRILAGVEAPDSGSVVVTPPGSTIAYLAQEPEAHGSETLSQLLGSPDRCRRGRRRARGGRPRRLPPPGRLRRPVLRRARALPGPRSSRLRGADGSVLDDLGLPARLLDAADGVALGGTTGSIVFGRPLLVTPRPAPPGRADERSRLRWARSSRGLPFEATGRSGRRESRPGVPGADRHRGGRHRRGVASGHDIRRGFCRLSSRPRPRPAAMPRRRTRATWPSATGYVPVSATNGSGPYGVPRRSGAIPRTGTRPNGTSGSTAPRSRPRRSGSPKRPWHASTPVEKPWEPWDLHLDLTIARRSGDVVARLSRRGRPPGRVEARPRSTWRCAGPTVSPSSVPTEAASRRSSLLCWGGSRSTSVRAGSAPRWSWVNWGRNAAVSPRESATLLGAFMAALGPEAPSPRRARCWPSSASGPRTSFAPRPRSRPGERTRAELALLVGPRDELPGPRRADQPSGCSGDRTA